MTTTKLEEKSVDYDDLYLDLFMELEAVKEVVLHQLVRFLSLMQEVIESCTGKEHLTCIGDALIRVGMYFCVLVG